MNEHISSWPVTVFVPWFIGLWTVMYATMAALVFTIDKTIVTPWQRRRRARRTP